LLIPDDIAETVVVLRDKYFDLKGLAVYSALAVPTLRSHIRSEGLPCFMVKGKIIIKKSEFDKWIESHRVNKKQDLSKIVDGIVGSLQG